MLREKESQNSENVRDAGESFLQSVADVFDIDASSPSDPSSENSEKSSNISSKPLKNIKIDAADIFQHDTFSRHLNSAVEKVFSQLEHITQELGFDEYFEGFINLQQEIYKLAHFLHRFLNIPEHVELDVKNVSIGDKEYWQCPRCNELNIGDLQCMHCSFSLEDQKQLSIMEIEALDNQFIEVHQQIKQFMSSLLLEKEQDLDIDKIFNQLGSLFDTQVGDIIEGFHKEKAKFSEELDKNRPDKLLQTKLTQLILDYQIFIQQGTYYQDLLIKNRSTFYQKTLSFLPNISKLVYIPENVFTDLQEGCPEWENFVLILKEWQNLRSTSKARLDEVQELYRLEEKLVVVLKKFDPEFQIFLPRLSEILEVSKEQSEKALLFTLEGYPTLGTYNQFAQVFKPANEMIQLLDQLAKDQFKDQQQMAGRQTGNKIFLSYSVKDQNIADTITHWLEQEGLDYWIASKDIKGSEEWISSILKGLSECNSLIFLISKDSQASKFVMKELVYAHEQNKLLIPIRIDNSGLKDQIAFMLKDIQYLNAYEGSIEKYQNVILTTIKKALNL